MDLRAWSVDVYGSCFLVDQPAELDAVGDPLIHFGLEAAESLCFRTDLDDELGYQGRSVADLMRAESSNALVANPRCIGATLRFIGQQVATGRPERLAGTVLSGPRHKLEQDLCLVSVGLECHTRLEEQRAVTLLLNLEGVVVDREELEELVVRKFGWVLPTDKEGSAHLENFELRNARGHTRMVALTNAARTTNQKRGRGTW